MNELNIYYTHIPINIDISTIEKHMYLLNKKEKARYNRLLVDHKKIEFFIGRCLLKNLLGSYLQIPSKEVFFQKNEYGKLFLHPCHNTDKLFFNLSHTERFVAIVLSPWELVGIDVELMKINNLRLISRVFTEEEINLILNQPTVKLKQHAFLLLWTRKEAVLKAKGVGISIPLTSFSVPCDYGETANKEYYFSSWIVKSDIMLSVAISKQEQIKHPTYLFHSIDYSSLYLGNN